MRHNLEIGIKEPPGGGIVGCRRVTVREKLFRFLLGEKRKLMIIVPGDSVKSLSIVEEEGTDDGKTKRRKRQM
jgi:hypothetical protein